MPHIIVKKQLTVRSAYYATSSKDEVYPRLVGGTEPNMDPPAECTTVGAEVFVIPEGWYHATLNTAETVAISRQYNAVLSASHRHEMSAMWWRQASRSAGEIVVSAPDFLFNMHAPRIKPCAYTSSAPVRLRIGCLKIIILIFR